MDKLNEYVKNSGNSFISEVFDYISDRALDYTELKDCIDDVIEDPNGLLLMDDEYINLYDKFEDEILSCLDSNDFVSLFKKLPTVKEYKIKLIKCAIECILVNFINIISE